jgi:hypothetical protein
MIYDAVVIGGGFYGSYIANYLSETRSLSNVLLVEQSDRLLSKASVNNQARVHGGFHYPRSFTTGFRSSINKESFVSEFKDAVNFNFSNYYAISKINSKVTSKQFSNFCKQIGANIIPASNQIRSLFNLRLIENVFCVDEPAFNAEVLQELINSKLLISGVDIQLNSVIEEVNQDNNLYHLRLKNKNSSINLISKLVFNCTYSGINLIQGNIPKTKNFLKHELTEMLLIQPPEILKNKSFTVMDGPFFSMMPYPSRNLYTLSHVRYTPHFEIADIGNSTYNIDHSLIETRKNKMLRDSSRYIPLLNESIYVDSIFEIKTVLQKNEVDDGRPILFEKNGHGYYSILGGKIDNIYDIIQRLNLELF